MNPRIYIILILTVAWVIVIALAVILSASGQSETVTNNPGDRLQDPGHSFFALEIAVAGNSRYGYILADPEGDGSFNYYTFSLFQITISCKTDQRGTLLLHFENDHLIAQTDTACYLQG